MAKDPGPGGRAKAGRRKSTALGTFGARVGRHAGIYGIGQGASAILSLVTLAVLTRFLPPAEFGLYILFYVFATLLMVLYTLGWIRGGLMWVFGPGGEDDDDDEEGDAADGGASAAADDKRRALGSAFAFIAAIALVGTAAVVALGPTIGALLGADPAQAQFVILAAGAGAAWSVWRLAATVTRRERRPGAYVFLTLSRPMLLLAATVPLVAVDPSVGRAVLGLAIGTAAAAMLSLVAVRRSFAFRAALSDFGKIIRLGLPFAPLIVSLWVIANGGVFFLAGYASTSEVGYFRVATSVAAIASLPVAAFLRAWGPLRREPIYDAVAQERGKLAAGGLMATYFVMVAVGILLGLALGAQLLVRIAPPAYAAAAPLIPIAGAGLVLFGWMRVVRRAGQYPGQKTWYISMAVVAALAFVGACLVLIPPLGTVGAAIALVVAYGTASMGMFVRSQLGPTPIPLGYGRIATALLIGLGCFAAALLLGGLVGPAAPLVDVVAFAAYPLLLLLCGVIPRGHVTPLRRMAVAAVPRRSRSNGHLALGGLEESDRAVLEILVRHSQPVDRVAPLLGVSTGGLNAGFVAALRRAGGVGVPSAADASIGAYLLSAAPVAARDDLWRRLSSQGTNPLEVDKLTTTLERLRRTPAEAWRPAGRAEPVA